MDELYKKIGVFNIEINKKQALEDLDILKYILLTAYSEMETLIKKGFDIDKCFDNLKNSILKHETINTKDFFEQIINSSLNRIKDFHLIFSNPYFNLRHVFCQHSQIYFSDIYVDKNEADKYDDNDLFPAISDNGTLKYIIGKMSDTPIDSMTITVSNELLQVPLHECKIKDLSKNTDLYSIYKIKNFDVIKCSRLTYFNDKEHKSLLEFSEYGKTLKNSKGIILDLRGNMGGDSHIALNFLKNLNTTAEFNFEYYKLDSLLSRLSELTINGYEYTELQFKREEYYSDIQSNWKSSEKADIVKGTYNNPFVILTDAETASSAEIFIKLCKNHINNCVIVGENTKGCLNTGDIRYFYLPNSLTFLNIPTARFPDIFEEGVGFIPDYWIDNDNPVNCIIKWLEMLTE